jgi:hypothetical protein
MHEKDEFEQSKTENDATTLTDNRKKNETGTTTLNKNSNSKHTNSEANGSSVVPVTGDDDDEVLPAEQQLGKQTGETETTAPVPDTATTTTTITDASAAAAAAIVTDEATTVTSDTAVAAPTISDTAVAAPTAQTNATTTPTQSETTTFDNTQPAPSVQTTTAAPTSPASSSSQPPPPVMKGTYCFELEPARRHLIRGMWNYDQPHPVFGPQRFELARTLGPHQDATILPQDGEFHGSFSLAYVHTTSKGKQKERSKVIPESGVQIQFVPVIDTAVNETDANSKTIREYTVQGKGNNQFGTFHLLGTATRHEQDPNSLAIVFRKRYEALPTEPSTTNTSAAGGSTTSIATATTEEQLPPPTKSFPSGVVCLRGTLLNEPSPDHQLGLHEHVHRIRGVWASGLDVLDDVHNQFEYEHKTSSVGQKVPVSGRYSGWFELKQDDASVQRIQERDVTLKFKTNNQGYYNVEGKGSNVFGRYTISGTMKTTDTGEHVVTIFRHFQPRKLKSKTGMPPLAPAAAAAPRRPSLLSAPTAASEFMFTLDDVPEVLDQPLAPIVAPTNAAYSAVSRGNLRINDDGSHSCQGKWAVTREHFTNGQTSNFHFRLEAHHAAEALQNTPGRPFPLDSAAYKGSFQLKKQGSRYQTIVDQQVVMKFHPNSQGSFNVYGKGTNAIGTFTLMGTLVMVGKTGGQVEFYRMYPPAAPTTAAPVPVSIPDAAVSRPTLAELEGALARRESSRVVRLPSKLEDDDPDALLSRTMQKCAQILRLVREKDIELGAFFSEPVDPVALGIPTYHQIVKEPMDLKTIHRRMETGAVEDPDDLARLVRLVFHNAMTFNVDPAHSVHQAARTLLVLFNQKFRDVERVVQNLKQDDDKSKKKGKDDKKRKRFDEPVKSLKKRRLEEAVAMSIANSNAVNAIVAAAPNNSSTVSRSEFNMLLNLIQQLQKQIVETHNAVADLCPGDENDMLVDTTVFASSSSIGGIAMAPVPEKKKAVKRKSMTLAPEHALVVEDYSPLSLEEQELLTETINELPPEHLGGVIQIIREAAPVGADEDEIDLEIDQLDNATQRKLLKHVMKVSSNYKRIVFGWQLLKDFVSLTRLQSS